MKKLMLTAVLVMLASPASAKEYTIKEVSDPSGDKPYYFSPDRLTIQPGDTVTFVNAQEDMHDVMFVEVPKGVDGMIMSPMHEKEGDKFSYTFNVSGTYKFHCHPHEALGMKGVLIVGQASKLDETVKMDHHKMSEEAEGGNSDAASTSNPENMPSPLTPEQSAQMLHDGKPVYSCPMKMTWFSDQPGQCPCCTMALEKVKDIKDGQAVLEENGSGMQMDMKDMKMMESK